MYYTFFYIRNFLFVHLFRSTYDHTLLKYTLVFRLRYVTELGTLISSHVNLRSPSQALHKHNCAI